MPSPDHPIIALRLADVRRERDLTQTALGALAGGITRATISALEHGQPPRLSTAIALAEALGVPFMIVAPPDGGPVELWVIAGHNERSAGVDPALRGKDGDAAPASTSTG